MDQLVPIFANALDFSRQCIMTAPEQLRNCRDAQLRNSINECLRVKVSLLGKNFNDVLNVVRTDPGMLINQKAEETPKLLLIFRPGQDEGVDSPRFGI
jgi:hypothetical protein